MIGSSCEVALEIFYHQMRFYYAKNHYFCPVAKLIKIWSLTISFILSFWHFF